MRGMMSSTITSIVSQRCFCMTPNFVTLIASLALLLSAQADAQPVSIANADFETGDLTGWRKFQHAGDKVYLYDVVPSEGAQGKYAARIRQSAPQFYGAISQYVAVSPLSRYRLTAKMKTVGTQDRGWRLYAVTQGGADGVESYGSEPLLGNTEWTEVKLLFSTSAKVTSVMIAASLGGEGIGLIDDIKLSKIGD